MEKIIKPNSVARDRKQASELPRYVHPPVVESKGVSRPWLIGKAKIGKSGKLVKLPHRPVRVDLPRRPRLRGDAEELEGEQNGEGSESIAKSLLDPSTVYKFRLVAFQAMTTNGAGTLSYYVSLSPGTTTFNEWSDLTPLFNEVRAVKASIRVVSLDPFYTSNTKSEVAINYDDGSSSTTPSSIVSVFDNPRSWIHSLSDGTTRTYSVALNSREWAQTSSPAPGPYAGCYGQFSFYQTSLSLSVYYLDVYLEVEFEFRNRT